LRYVGCATVRAAAFVDGRGGVMDGTLSIGFSQHGRDGMRVHVSGPRTLGNTIEYWRQIAEQAALLRPRKLLLVDDLAGHDLAPHEWEELVQAMAGYGLEQMRIAHVKRTGLDHLEYCEIYANAAGIEARVFDDEREAERWLRYGVADGAAVPPRWTR
jgi:hypothetical protein